MDVNYSIIASSKEEFETTEKALKKFNEHYKITNNAGILNAKKLIDNMIQIYPGKYDMITEVAIASQNLEGHLLKSTPEFCLIGLGENRYSVEYTNPDFRKNKK